MYMLYHPCEVYIQFLLTKPEGKVSINVYQAMVV